MAQINKVRNEKGVVTSNTRGIQRTLKTTKNNYIPMKGQPKRNGQTSRNEQPPKTEIGRIRKYEQTNY